MYVFFALAAREIWESLLSGEHLSMSRKAAMPLATIVDGMIEPMLIYRLGSSWR